MTSRSKSPNRVIPTIFAHNKKEFDERFKKVLPISKQLQIDFMDGKFVPQKSVQLRFIPQLNQFKKLFEAHLMVKEPNKWVSKVHNKGFKKCIVHCEVSENKTIELIKKHNMVAMVAINPETPLRVLQQFVGVNEFLLMGVHPGKEKQKLVPQVYQNIRSLRKLFPKSIIQIDGGVNDKTIVKLFKAGANRVNSGSFVSSNDNSLAAKKYLESLIKN